MRQKELLERIDGDYSFLAELLELFRGDYPGCSFNLRATRSAAAMPWRCKEPDTRCRAYWEIWRPRSSCGSAADLEIDGKVRQPRAGRLQIAWNWSRN